MDWMIELVAAIVLTGITGSVFLLVWHTIGKILDQMGYMNLLYDMLFMAGLFFLLPLAYTVLYLADSRLGVLGGNLFWMTQEMMEFSKGAFTVWLAGGVSVTIYQIGIGIYAHFYYHKGYPCNQKEMQCFRQTCAELEISGDDVKVMHSYHIKVPCLTGLRNQRLLLPAETFDEEMLHVIFLHELTHYKQKHLWLNAFEIGITCLHWCNPFAWWFRRLAEQWCEYDCDARVGTMVRSVKLYILMLTQVTGKCGVIIGNKVALFQTKSELLRRIERMNRYAQGRKKSRMLAFVMCAVMAMTNSVTVCAASLGVAGAYTNAYKETVREVEEQIREENSLEEYEMSGIPDDVVVEEGEVQYGTRGTALLIDWGVGIGVYKRTDRFEANSGDRITISIWIDPDDVAIRAGIVEPDGTLRYVEASGSITHTFTLDQTGDYRVFVQNISKTNYVYISGSCGVR